jgi:predicted N-acetyltransferase YhbS
MIIRELERKEIEHVWRIDRSEVIDHVYCLRDGRLVLQPEHYDMKGWPPGEPEHYTPILCNCFDRGGTFWGAFEGAEMIGVAALESKLIGRDKNQLQLKFLHVSRSYRKQGLGKALFEMAVEKAGELGAKKLYISATPSQNTVDFYLSLGCVLAQELDPELFELEPEDIHLEYSIPLRAER